MACKMDMVKLTKAEWDKLGIFETRFLLEHEAKEIEEFKFRNKLA